MKVFLTATKTNICLLDALRKADTLALSLVAEHKDKVVGHIAFSEVTITGKQYNWYGLAPVSVLPEFQNRGIGSALILEGSERIKKMGAHGCVLLGEPDYYRRFGFEHSDQLILEGVPAEYFLVNPFTDEHTAGKVDYHPLFTEYS